MKKILLLSIVSLGLCSLNAQVSDNVSLEPGYANQSFYSFENGEIASVPAQDWDLAFSCGSGSSAIRINDGYGVKAYKYPNGDISNWSEIDSTGLSTWIPDYNSELTWATGAFDQTADGFDVGWGDYNVITHIVTGTDVFIIQTLDMSWKKVAVESLISGDYIFKYADLDGSNESTHTLSKSDYTGKNFGYFSLATETEIDREPDSDSWDITFTKYIGELSPGVNYGVTGALSNYGVSIAQADGVDVTTANYMDYSFEGEINVIGYDWKSFNGMQFVLTPDLTYFVNDVNGNVYQITFTNFEGSSSGVIEFETTLLMTSAITNLDKSSAIKVFPNPTQGTLQLEFNSVNTANTLLTITDLAGRLILNEQVVFSTENSKHRLDLAGNTAGIYILTIVSEGIVSTEKIVLK
tara:strand:- start:1278 stop:2504 length:1227 start_codon:yes stop_codon:yes gene_type:complete